MANRRMISNRIVNSGKFLQMPLEAQALYFHIIIKADDDGVVETYPIMRLLGAAPDTLKVLIAKNYIQVLNEDQVVVIKDWLEHNVIRADRKVDSIYRELLPENVVTIEAKPRSDVKDNSNRIGGQSTVGISKVRLGKVRVVTQGLFSKEDFDTFWEQYPNKVKKKDALKSFLKIKGVTLEFLLERLELHKASEKWNKDRGSFISHPTSWLNGELWNDELKPYRPELEEQGVDILDFRTIK